MEVSVIIPTWQRPDVLRRCLAALDGQSSGVHEVLVIVRKDDRATRLELGEMRPRNFVPRPVPVDVPGVVAALRAGLAVASGEIIAITDDDATPWPDWIERLEAHYRERASVGGVGGPDRLPGDRGRALDPRTEVGRVRPYGRVVGNHHLGAGSPRRVDVLKGVNLSMRRHAIPEPALDHRLRGEGAQVHWELALCLALRRAGWVLVYDPAVGVDHFPAQRFGTDQRDGRPLRALADEVHNETYVLLRWLPPWQSCLALAYGLLVGSRKAPGLFVAAERLLRERPRGPLLARFGTAQRARLAACRTVMGAW